MSTMKLRKESKIALVIIFIVTGTLFFSARPPDNSKEDILTSNLSNKTGSKDLNGTKSTDLKKSLTNVTETFFLSDEEYKFRGFIQGISYSSFSFYMNFNEAVQLKLTAHKDLEMMIYGSKAYTLKNTDKFVAPEAGIYELRVFFKPNIEFNLSSDRYEEFSLNIKKLK
ncbi:hypothetical protein [Taylorella asinigenitalis]|uniref:hypothetical protein n=1 Tax=Taylorella asinigenitalis TaxID=84590 RepID=UPI0002E6795B|nr:hypothetical protein [Taylorella asinigenitalis]